MMKPIPNCDGYWVNESGAVFSFWRRYYKMGKSGPCHDCDYSTPPKEIKPFCGSGGYWGVKLSVGGKKQTRLVHRIVLESFLGPCPDGMIACHGPNGKNDNSLKNLCWDTYSNNMKRDTKRDGTYLSGERSSNAKLTQQDVNEIRKLKVCGLSNNEIGRRFKVTGGAVGDIMRGRTWQSPSS